MAGAALRDAMASLPHASSSSSMTNGYSFDELAAVNGHATNGMNGHARRGHFDGLHEEDEDERTEEEVDSQAGAAGQHAANLRHGFDYPESVLAEDEQLRTSTWLPWTDVRSSSSK